MFDRSKPKIGCSSSITNKWTRSSSFDVRKMMFEFVRCSIKWCSTHHYWLLEILELSWQQYACLEFALSRISRFCPWLSCDEFLSWLIPVRNTPLWGEHKNTTIYRWRQISKFIFLWENVETLSCFYEFHISFIKLHDSDKNNCLLGFKFKNQDNKL